MILVSEIVSILESRLDAKGSDYYNFDDNYKTAINESVKFIVSLIDRAVEENKITTEVLYTLQKCAVITLSKFSRFTYDDSVMWSIRSINPLPLTVNNGSPTVTQPDDNISVTRTDLTHVYSNYWCKRLTKEEWEINSGNPFAPGNTVLKCSDFQDGSSDNVSFAYLNPYFYGQNKIKQISEEQTITTPVYEIEVRPYIPKRNVSVFYVQKPQSISTVNDEIVLHSKLIGFLVEKCLQYISYQQGDGTSIFVLSRAEIQSLVNILS